MSGPEPCAVYKICTSTEWREATAAGAFRGSAVDLRDGFIHLSTGAQLGGTLGRHFAGQLDLVLVELDPDELGAALRWEKSRGGELFPHLYGPLAVSLARSVEPVEAPPHAVRGKIRPGTP